MAKQIEAFDKVQRRGRSAIYPYDEWLDGNIWQLSRGDDFGSAGQDKPKVSSFLSNLRGAAHTRGYGLKAIILDDDTVQVQRVTKRPRKAPGSTSEGNTATESAADEPKAQRGPRRF